jgi:cobalt-zinc-cadmium efflux system outer membrane protein
MPGLASLVPAMLAVLLAPAAPTPTPSATVATATASPTRAPDATASPTRAPDVAASATATGCRGSLTGAAAVRCALATSPALRAAEAAVDAAAGRREAARTVLPSNPTAEVTVAARRGLWSGERDVNVYGRLSQELEVAGQRGKRRRVAEADQEVARRRVDALRRELAAEVLSVHVEALAAREQQAMVGRMAAAAGLVVERARAGEKAGLGSGLELDLASLIVIRLGQQAIEAERRLATAHALLAGLVGEDPAQPTVQAAGSLTPLPVPEDISALLAGALATRAELDVARAEREMFERRADLYRRMRVPNPSLVLFAQRDGFNERVLGGGIAFPIALPSPLGRGYRGEIAENQALARQAGAELERLQRQVRAEVVVAAENLKARRAEVLAFDPARLARAEAHITALGEEMASGRLSIREAALLQQSFLELLAANLEARRAEALAAVELARVAGLLPQEVAP